MTRMLDASAVLCWLLDAPGAARMSDILADEEEKLIQGVNLVEVHYRLLRLDAALAEAALVTLFSAGVGVDRTLDDGLLAIAADLKRGYAPIALGDAFAVAAAIQRGATLLTTDRGELEKVAAAVSARSSSCAEQSLTAAFRSSLGAVLARPCSERVLSGVGPR